MGCCGSTESFEEERVSLISPASINGDERWVRSPAPKSLNRPIDRYGEPSFGGPPRTPLSGSVISPSRVQDGQQRLLNRIVQRTLRNFIDISQVGDGVGSVIGDGIDKTDRYDAAIEKARGPAKQLSFALPEPSFLDDDDNVEDPTASVGQFSRAQNDFVRLCTDSLTKTLQRMDVQDCGQVTISFSEASFSLGNTGMAQR